MTDFDLLFRRLRGLAWPHACMAAACFMLGCSLFVAPLWDYADAMGVMRILSFFCIGAGACSLIGAYASEAPWAMRCAEPVAGVILLACGLWTLNFPPSPSLLKTLLFTVGVFMAFYVLVTAAEMERRGAGRWLWQLVVSLVSLAVAFAGLFGLAGASGMLPLFALGQYVAAWGFVYAGVSLSVEADVR